MYSDTLFYTNSSKRDRLKLINGGKRIAKNFFFSQKITNFAAKWNT